MANELRTFVFVSEGRVLSPPLTTIREYARWMENYFDNFTCQLELYLCSKKKGETVLEWHPGTKIGRFFDMQGFHQSDYISWYLPVDTKGMQQLIKHNFAQAGDARGKLLRLYTVRQIEVYIKTVIDHEFEIGTKILEPVQITLSKEDAQRLVKPKMQPKRKLF